MIHKTDSAYKSIGEVAKILNLVNEKKGTLNTHTIRFWKKNLNKSGQEYYQVIEGIIITIQLNCSKKLNFYLKIKE